VRRAAALMLAGAMACTASMATEPAAAAAEPEFHILQDGDAIVYHPGEAPLHPGPGWLALDVVGGLWHLLPATLRGERARDEIADSDDGVRLHADPAGALLYLRLPGLVAGKVDTPDLRFKGHARELDASTALALPFKGHVWNLDGRHGELVLSEGSSRMSFGPMLARSDPDFDTEEGLMLLWAGDLDRDGRLDFIVEGNGNNSKDVCVWLSSRAKPGELLGEPTCWHTIGC